MLGAQKRIFRMEDRVALITGAAGGIGLATAKALHRRGATVVVTDLDAAAIAEAATEIGPDRTLGLACDVTDRAALDHAVAAAIERFGGLDVVMANAGVASDPATVLTMDEANFERTIAVDLFGVWNTVRAALPAIVERRGHAVLVASIYAFAPALMATPYAMSKAAVEQLGRALRIELAPHGAGATVAYFGFVDTPMTRAAFSDPRASEFVSHVPWWLRRQITSEQAGEAVARAVERRAPRLVAPRGWAFMSWTRGISDRLADRFIVRERRVMEMVAESERQEADARTD